MLFSSMVFIWVFLPIVLISYRLINEKYRNLLLLIASLIFYAWGEPVYILLMIASICVNYASGVLVDGARTQRTARVVLTVCVLVNLGLLIYFKYFNFLLDNFNAIFNMQISARTIMLPIGISFFTFQALSYVVDVYRGKYGSGETKVQRNIIDLAVYVALFPQLIAGPIVKYHDVAEQIKHREISSGQTAYGITRFAYGLAKKVLLSNTLALAADKIFALPSSELGTSVAWLGIICYTLQIYFDFSGYSDMAVGLGKMFGFTFMENFNLPYISKSIREFWRRWHISLSAWFREYLYIPLGGNRKGVARTYINLFIVFLATGIWHGASWNFMLWGIYNGFFIIIERAFLGKLLDKSKVLSHVYTIAVFTIGWVFFRAETLGAAVEYLRTMFVWTPDTYNPIGLYLNRQLIITLAIGLMMCGPIQAIFPAFWKSMFNQERLPLWKMATALGLIAISIISLASGTYNPFIYFRF